jgi:hypothetical protein
MPKEVWLMSLPASWLRAAHAHVQEWLQQRGRSDADVAAIREGYRVALGKDFLAVISFRDFVRTFSWFASTLQMMTEQDQSSGASNAGLLRVPSGLSNAHSARSSDGGPSREEPQANGDGNGNGSGSPVRDAAVVGADGATPVKAH